MEQFSVIKKPGAVKEIMCYVIYNWPISAI
jgi:hypothetical protein